MTLGYSQFFPDGQPTNFKDKILQRPGYMPKLHSIREDVHERWRPDLDIHHVYGNRTPQRDCFLVNKCVWVQRIIITTLPDIVLADEEKEVTQGEGWTNIKMLKQGYYEQQGKKRQIFVDGRILPTEKCEELAINDGFNSLEHFYSWFREDFSGKILHWTKLRY